MFRTRCTTGGRGRARSCAAVVAGATLLASTAAGVVGTAAVAGAAVFLIHPLQTESVSYIAGRSESLAAMFVLLAYMVFLYRRHEAISWVETAAVLALFGLGVSTKENAVSLAGILVLTDVYWPQPFSTRGLRNNWKLYAAMVPGALLATFVIVRMLATVQSAGFSVPNLTWYQYGFTEARAFFTYARMAAIPLGQSIDHDYPVSHTILQHGAIFYLAALAGLIAVCYRWRKRYPLACFGLGSPRQSGSRREPAITTSPHRRSSPWPRPSRPAKGSRRSRRPICAISFTSARSSCGSAGQRRS